MREVPRLPISVAARSKARVCGRSLAGIAISNPAGAWMCVCCDCCVLSVRGLCVGLITRPEQSYRVRCVIVKPRLGGVPGPLLVVGSWKKMFLGFIIIFHLSNLTGTSWSISGPAEKYCNGRLNLYRKPLSKFQFLHLLLTSYNRSILLWISFKN
jgi:hypothetical protein